jgi:hypothetical protein
MNINTSLDTLGNLLALIQDANPGFASVTEDQLAVVSIAAQTPDSEGRNAVATVTVDGYDDQGVFQYTRLGLTDSIATAPAAVSVSNTETQASITAAIAAALNLVASEITVSGAAINADGSVTPPTPNADGTVVASVTVVSNSASALYADGSTLSFVLNFPSVVVTPPVNPSINTIITNTALNGFAAVTTPVVTPPAGDGTTTTPPADGTTPPAADGTTPPAADGTSSTPPAADGTSTAPATDGTSAGTTPAADGTTAPAADGTTAPVAPAADGTTAAPAADGQAAAPAA